MIIFHFYQISYWSIILITCLLDIISKKVEIYSKIIGKSLAWQIISGNWILIKFRAIYLSETFKVPVCMTYQYIPYKVNDILFYLAPPIPSKRYNVYRAYLDFGGDIFSFFKVPFTECLKKPQILSDTQK